MNGSNSARNGAYDFIPPEKAPVKRGARSVEIVDAEFEVINSPLRAHYRILNDNRFGKASQRRKTHWLVVMFYAAVLTIEKPLGRMGAKSFAGLVGASFLIVFGLVIFASDSEAPMETTVPAGVAVSSVDTSVIDSNGLRIIEVTGSVKNVSGHDLTVPPLAANVESSGETRSIMVFKLGQPVLPAGQSAPFTLKMPHPGGKVPKVSVTADAGTE